MENIREEDLGKVSGGSDIDDDYKETFVLCQSCKTESVRVFMAGRGACTNRNCDKFNVEVAV